MRLCFLAAVERKPRIECFCQSVALTISARLAPLGREISSRIFAPLLSARGVLASLVRPVLAAFLPALASFFGEALVLPPLAAFRDDRAWGRHEGVPTHGLEAPMSVTDELITLRGLRFHYRDWPAKTAGGLVAG